MGASCFKKSTSDSYPLFDRTIGADIATEGGMNNRAYAAGVGFGLYGPRLKRPMLQNIDTVNLELADLARKARMKSKTLTVEEPEENERYSPNSAHHLLSNAKEGLEGVEDRVSGTIAFGKNEVELDSLQFPLKGLDSRVGRDFSCRSNTPVSPRSSIDESAYLHEDLTHDFEFPFVHKDFMNDFGDLFDDDITEDHSPRRVRTPSTRN